MAQDRGNPETLRTVHRGLVSHAKALDEWTNLLLDAGWPSFAGELAREAWHLEQVADRMQARLQET